LFSLSPQFGDLLPEYHPILTNNLTILGNFQNWGKLGECVEQVGQLFKIGAKLGIDKRQKPPYTGRMAARAASFRLAT